MRAQDRIERVQEETRADLPQAVARRLADLLEHLEDILGQPAWDGWVEAHSHKRVETPRRCVSTIPKQNQIKPSRASPLLASDGGAYTYLEVEPTDSPRPGPLSGWTFAVKDLLSVAGHPLGACSAVRADAPAEASDAAIVALLRDAGGKLVGGTTLHEFAFGVTGLNAICGTTTNPRDPSRIAGGSSTGSAVAVAEGSARFAVGTDTGGSVRIPAALCGVVGFKPSYGLYPRDGVFPLSPSLDHVGLLAQDMADLASIHQALGFDQPEARAPKALGIARGDLESADHQVRGVVEAALDRIAAAGVRLVEVKKPDPETVFAASTAVMFAEAGAVHRADMERVADRYGEDVRARLVLGMAIPSWLYLRGKAAQARLTMETRAELEGVEGLMGPTVEIPAPTLAEAASAEVSSRLVSQTRLANLVGAPALTLPLPVDGLPVGLHFMGLDDGEVLGAGIALEAYLVS